MKIATLFMLWDLSHCAMPWNAPKSLCTDEDRSVTAFLINLGGELLDGLTTAQAADTRKAACMKDGAGAANSGSFLPEHVRFADGNVAEQNRTVVPQDGVDARRPVGTTVAAKVEPAESAQASDVRLAAPTALFNKYACTTCHAANGKLVGGVFRWNNFA